MVCSVILCPGAQTAPLGPFGNYRVRLIQIRTDNTVRRVEARGLSK